MSLTKLLFSFIAYQPDNVLVNQDGQVKLADFGCSREVSTLTYIAPTALVGSFPYKSLDRLEEKGTAVIDDLWSLGIMLIELATGRFPIPKQSDEEEYAWMSTEPLKDGVIAYPTFPRLLNELTTQSPPTISLNFFTRTFKKFVDKCLSFQRGDTMCIEALSGYEFLQHVSSTEPEFIAWIRCVCDN